MYVCMCVCVCVYVCVFLHACVTRRGGDFGTVRRAASHGGQGFVLGAGEYVD